MRILFVLGLIVTISSAQQQQPQSSSSVTVGKTFQDNSNVDGIDLRQLLASAEQNPLQSHPNTHSYPDISPNQFLNPNAVQGYQQQQQSGVQALQASPAPVNAIAVNAAPAQQQAVVAYNAPALQQPQQVVQYAAPAPQQVLQYAPPAQQVLQYAAPAQQQLVQYAPQDQQAVVQLAAPAPQQSDIQYGAPAQLQTVQFAAPAPQQPNIQYGVPAQQVVQYASPAPQPVIQYASPAPQPTAQYAAPAPQPVVQYAPAPQPIQYAAPAPQPQIAYAAPSPALPATIPANPVAPAQLRAVLQGPTPAYGSPAYNPPPPSTNYGPPPRATTPVYGPPQRNPVPVYNPPKPAPTPNSAYGPPAYNPPSPAYGPPSRFAEPAPVYGTPAFRDEPQVIKKDISVHLPPPEIENHGEYVRQPRVFPKPEKRYTILFIKSPDPPKPGPQDYPQLPPAPEQKTLVYVLVKKPEPVPTAPFILPEPTKPSKPEVYFIRYKSQPKALEGGYGAPPLNLAPPSTNYGIPQQQQALFAPTAPLAVPQAFYAPVAQQYGAPDQLAFSSRQGSLAFAPTPAPKGISYRN